FLLRVGELRNRDRGQNADDHDHDQKLDQSETLAVHLENLPCIVLSMGARVYRARNSGLGRSTNYTGRGMLKRKCKHVSRLGSNCRALSRSFGGRASWQYAVTDVHTPQKKSGEIALAALVLQARGLRCTSARLPCWPERAASNQRTPRTSWWSWCAKPS